MNLCSEDITTGNWTHTPFVAGEILQAPTDQSVAEWIDYDEEAASAPITWLRYNVGAVASADYYAVSVDGLSKGQVFVNGHMLGRYWNELAIG